MKSLVIVGWDLRVRGAGELLTSSKAPKPQGCPAAVAAAAAAF